MTTAEMESLENAERKIVIAKGFRKLGGELHEAAEDLFGVIIDLGAGKADAGAV